MTSLIYISRRTSIDFPKSGIIVYSYLETGEGAENIKASRLEEPIGIYRDFFFFFLNCVLACV